MSLIQTTKIFRQLEESDKRIRVFQGGTRCFTEDTLIYTNKGHKTIKDIVKGDKVLSYDNKFHNIIDKFIYEYEHTLLRLNLKNGEEIKCIPEHRFLFKGEWIRAIDIAKRVVERNKEHKRSLSDKQFWKDKSNELEAYENNQNNENCKYEKESNKKHGLLPTNDDINKWKIRNSTNTQISSKSIYKKPKEQTRSESQERENKRQQSRELGMGNPLGELPTFFRHGTTNSKERLLEWYEQIDRERSNGNKVEVQTQSRYGKRFSQRVWREFINNKGHSLQKKKQDILASCEIKLNDITNFKIYKKHCKVYDLQVADTQSFCITKNNIIVHNSSKTYNIVIWWIVKLMNENNKVLTVCRETLPSLKGSVYLDFVEIMGKMGIYDTNNMRFGDMTYKLGTNIIQFKNLDDDQKVRGSKRDYLYINEANEVSYPIWKQLIFRTKDIAILDYNPSDEYHWIYDEVLTRDDCDFFKSTYLDNPFLPIQQVKEIERLRELDPNYWRIYGLGERGMSEATIYKNWELTDEPKPKGFNCYGLDFGFNDPNAFVDMVIVDCEEPYIWVDELIYQNQLSTPELIELIKTKNITPYDTIYGDNSRPETIQEIRNAGFNIHPCSKGKGSIKAGIDWIKRYKVKITKRSVNIQKEIKSYKWKVTKDEKVLDEPVDINNHALDSLRYSLTDKINSIDYGCSF